MSLEEQFATISASQEVPADIEEWNTKTLVDYATVICTARRRSGKSFAIQRILSDNRKKYDEIYIFSKTIDIVPESEYAFIPTENKYNFLDEDKIKQLLEKQNNILNYNKSRPPKEHIKNHICIILDDILTDATFRKPNNVVSELFVQGRHSKISLFVLVQSFSGREGIPPVLRKNADYIMTFYQHNVNDIKSMAEQYLSIVDTKLGMEYLKRITNQAHTMCVIDVNNVSARSYGEYLYKYKAPDKKLPKFMIGDEDKKLDLGESIFLKPPVKASVKVITRIRTKTVLDKSKKNISTKQHIRVRTVADPVSNISIVTPDPIYNI